ncbi:putative feruloyl esterase [Lizonia empirigonia]|nr:putative feruloyl esterase [Lizonia empirigonia]
MYSTVICCGVALRRCVGALVCPFRAQPVRNFTSARLYPIWINHGPLPDVSIDFCNVTLTHTHPGNNDTLHTQIWLPLNPTKWNKRMQMAGGGGWSAGFQQAFSGMYGAITEGYATSTVDGGVHVENAGSPAAWALKSPGNVDYEALQNFAFKGLVDGALATKSIIESYYGHAPDYSYWSGCSQGGRQGYMFAERFPDMFDGIAAAAPAINWNQFFVGSTYPQQVLYELKPDKFPHTCEYEALTQSAIAACDGNDGVFDGLISDPDRCYFNPRTLIGSPTNCSVPGGPSVISETAAPYSYSPEADLAGFRGILHNDCSNNGTCVPLRLPIFTDWIKYFIKKNPDYDVNTMTREEWVSAFHAGRREYTSIIGTDYPDLSEFRASGGKLLTYHGLADELIPHGGTRDYFEKIAVSDPNVRDFYRYFEAPGATHCYQGKGGVPGGAFAALVDWVEHGAADREYPLCVYPKKAVFKGDAHASSYTAEEFDCR